MKSFDELIDELAGIIDAKETKEEETVSFDIKLSDSRNQLVHVIPFVDEFNNECARYISVAGDVEDFELYAVLEANYNSVSGFAAILDEKLVVVESQIIKTADIEEVHQAVLGVGQFADWLEENVSKQDKY